MTVQAFAIDTIDAKDLQKPALNGLGKSVDQTPIFVVEESALPRWKDQHFRARVSKDQQFHFTIQMRTEPPAVLALHLPSEYGVLFPGSAGDLGKIQSR